MNKADNVASHPQKKSPVPRRFVLALVLGLLGVLILFVTANAYVAKRTESSLVDFDSGTFLYTGLLDIPPDVHSVQLLPIGLTGAWGESQAKLPVRLNDLGAIANGDVIYAVGGKNHLGQWQNGVYSTKMTGLGGELEPWTTENALPEERSGASLAVHRLNADTSMLYVIGGQISDFTAVDTVLRAQIDNDTGAVGAWTTDNQHLPDPLYYGASVEHNDYLYVLGGYSYDGYTGKSLREVHYAPINTNGSLGSFTEAYSLPQALFNTMAVVYDGLSTDTLYVIGGTDWTTSTFKVYFADFQPDGSLTDWTLSDGNMPIHLYGHSGVMIRGGEILVTGGIADALDPTTGISSTVKAALVDTDNPSFRLYDWCMGVAPPTCTIGAWQTGGLMPEVRAFHGTAEGHGYVYVIAGRGTEGDDTTLRARDTVFFGTVNGVGGLYSPEGTYVSNEIGFGQLATLRQIDWQATLGHPGEMGVTMQYRTSADGSGWSAWSDPEPSSSGANSVTPDPLPTGIRYIQYQAYFSTTVPNASPLLDQVEIYYEVGDPDLAVRKDTGTVISAQLGTELEYTIYYTNTGGWVAKNPSLTETLPANTDYAGGPEWEQIGSSNKYTRDLANIPRGGTGSVTFTVQVADQNDLPPNTYHITNQVRIGYPTMSDEFNQDINDPNLADNEAWHYSPLALRGFTVTKDADPPPGSIVAPGSQIRYTLRYTNTGLARLDDVKLTDFSDATSGYTILSMTPEPTTTVGTTHTWELGDLDPRQAGEIEVLVQVNDPLPYDWPVNNRANLGSSGDDTVYTEVLTHWVRPNIPDPEFVDLTVTNLRSVPTSPGTDEAADFYVTIANIGDLDATTPFYLELYIKPASEPPPEWPSDHDMGYCLFDCAQTRINYLKYLGSLASGTGAEILFSGADLVFPNTCTGGAEYATYDVYAQIDVADVPNDNAFWGAYPEADESNNLFLKSYQVPCGPRRAYLPLVFKNTP